VGTWSVVISFCVMTLWLPLKERVGLGTLVNAVNVGMSMDISTFFIPQAQSDAVSIIYLIFGLILGAFGSGLYLTAGFGPGPRDGLMTGLAKFGLSIRFGRFSIEGIILCAGILLGGRFGLATIAFAIFIGPLVQFFMTRLATEIKA